MGPPKLDRHLAAYLAEAGYLVRPPYEIREMPDRDAYKFYASGLPVYHPWQNDADIATLMADLAKLGTMTLVDWDRMWTLKWAFLQTAAYRRDLGSWRVSWRLALMLKRLMLAMRDQASIQRLRLFDSFEGLPAVQAGLDLHEQGNSRTPPSKR